MHIPTAEPPSERNSHLTWPSATHPPRGRALPLSLSLSLSPLSVCTTFFARPVSQARIRGAFVSLDNFLPHPFTGNLHRLILARKPDKSRPVPSVPLHNTSKLGQAALIAIIFGVVGHDTIASSDLCAVHQLRICTRPLVLELWVKHAFVDVVLEDKLAEQYLSVTAQRRRGSACACWTPKGNKAISRALKHATPY